MIRCGAIFGILLCLAVLSGCGSSGISLDEIQVVSLVDLPLETPKRENEWRRAWAVAGGDARRVEVVVPAGADTLRLGLLPRGASDVVVAAEVYLAGEKIAAFTAEDPLAWTDERITFTPVNADRRASLVLQSEREFWVGPFEAVGPAASAPLPNVLVVLIDTLRQDHLSCYGYPRATSPVIDGLAAEGFRFDTLVPQSSWTRPSVATLLTGVYPGTHGAIDRDTPMQSGMPSLAAGMRDAGYETHAIVMNPSVLPTWNIGTDFDRFVDLVAPVAEETDDGVAVSAAIETIHGAAGRPWFLYLHLMGPHDPYLPPAPYDTMFSGGGHYPPETQALVDQYDGEIAYTDAQIGRLLAALRSMGVYDDTLIVVLSDHGEQFGEHGAIGHGHSLHEEELRVPFVMKLPGQSGAGTTIDTLVEVADIAPTLLSTLGQPLDSHFQGTSFSALFEGAKVPARNGYAALHLGKASMDMARDATWKFVRDHAADTRVWFDLAADPGEGKPLTAEAAGRDDLEAHATRVAALGATGLNVLLTAGDDAPDSIEVVFRGAELGAIEVDYFPECLRITEGESERIVHLDLHHCHSDLVGARTWYAEVEQDSAHITMDVSQGAEIAVEVRQAGRVLEDAVFTGAAMTPYVPASGTSIVASPRAFDPAILPRKLAAYVWYTPAPARIADDALDPEMLRQLESLGYLR